MPAWLADGSDKWSAWERETRDRHRHRDRDRVGGGGKLSPLPQLLPTATVCIKGLTANTDEVTLNNEVKTLYISDQSQTQFGITFWTACS